MPDVTITYKGSSIASLSGSGAKTLKTAGKYCEADIEVSYTAPTPTPPSGTISVKRWTHTNASLISDSQVVTLVANDNWLAEHYNDATLEVTAQGIGQRDVSDGNTYWIRTTGRNTPWNVNYTSAARQIISRFGTSNTCASIDGRLEGTQPNSRGMLRIDSQGNLMVKIDANCMMAAGDYEIIARLVP